MRKTFYDRNKILVLILTLLLLLSLLICIFEVFPYKKLFKETEGKDDKDEGTGKESVNDGSKGNEEGEISIYVGKASCLKCERQHLPHVPIFEIYGVTFSSYLRVLVGETYRDGSWFLLNGSSVSAYYGEKIKQMVTEYLESTPISFRITPLLEFRSCFIPSMINPLLLNFPINANILYYNDQIIFFSEGTMGNYQVTYINYLIDEEALSSATLIFDERYLDVPNHLMQTLRSLAFKIVEESNAKTPYEKLKAIEKYLRINYEYDENYTSPPEGYDPVLWFLFHEKRGVCIHFNSAFVLLARSIGMSARLVAGYFIKPKVENQTVYADQTHAYAEAPFKDFGWIIFDATGGENGGDTNNKGEERDEGGTERIKIRIGKCECCFDNLTCAPLFEIYGTVKSPYLRVLVGEIYENGVWSILDDSPSLKYNGESIKQLVTNYVSSSLVYFQVIPLSTIEGFIPSTSNPLVLRLSENKDSLLYYADQQIFFSEGRINSDYYVTYMNYLFDEKMLTLASTPSDHRYLNVSQHLLSAIKPLALEITEKYGAETTYEKLRAVEDFLKNNYIYNKNYMSPPEGYDPVLWFLFHEKRGVCIHFNSAFVLLARSLGIPSRLVGGYLIDPEQNYQVVYKCQTHAYAEVLFEGLGWIIFDATPPGCCGYSIKPIYTITEIVHLDTTGIKGSTFRVLGQAVDEYGSGINGLTVKIYLKRNKNEDALGFPVGEGVVKNGVFNVTCIVPLNINIGDYFVIAHTLSNDKYLGSWSDPQIRIISKTSLSVEAPERVIAGRAFVINGTLKEEGSNFPVANETIAIILGSHIYKILTNNNGSFLIKCLVTEPGNYTILVKFDGTIYYLASSIERDLQVLNLGITSLVEGPFIRGEQAHIYGRIHAEEIPGDKERVIIILDGVNVAETITDSNGYFSTSFLMPSNYTLGLSKLSYFLPSNGCNITQIVKVMARTQIITLTLKSPMESDKTFNISATLIDDLQQPIQGATIFLRYSLQDQDFSVNSTTNENGTVLFSVNLSVNKEENISYSLIFLGNEVYLGTQFSGIINIIPTLRTFTHNIFLPLIIFIIGSSFSAYFLYTRGWLRRKITDSHGEVAKIQEETIALVSPTSAKENTNLMITFPEIKEPFPLVWGLNERLTVRLEIKGDNGTPIAKEALEICVDDKERAFLTSSQNGDVEMYLMFTEKGKHKLRAHFAGSAQWNEAVAEANIRIVDYREEVVNLFNSFIETLLKRYQGLNIVMTAREIQSKLVGQISESKNKYLEDMVSTFEVANYSLHVITRREYERMFLAKLNFEG